MVKFSKCKLVCHLCGNSLRMKDKNGYIFFECSKHGDVYAVLKSSKTTFKSLTGKGNKWRANSISGRKAGFTQTENNLIKEMAYGKI